MWATDEVWTSRLTAHSGRPLTLAARSKIARRLGSLDLHPSMPPSAILIVRRLTAAAPLGAGRPSDWSRAVRSRLEGFHAQAARPALGNVGEADAVLFADEAEMLACLLADALDGRVGRRWWWRAVLRRLGPITSAAIFAAGPRRIPSLAATLDRLGAGERAVAAIPPREARALLAEMLVAHGRRETVAQLEDILGILAEPPAPPAGEPTAREEAAQDAPGELPRGVRHGSISPTPEPLTVNQMLLDCARELHRAPGRALPATLVARWTAMLPASQPPQARSDSPPSQPTAPRGPTTEARRPAFAKTETSAKPAPAGAPASARLDGPRPAPPAEVCRTASERTRAERIAPPAAPLPESETAPAAGLPDRESDLAGLPTGLLGAFYWIQLFERLDLPDCFEPDWPLSSGVSRWALLELACRGLLAASSRSERYADDSLWAALAQLDGRPAATPPDAEFPERDAFRLPETWAADLARDDDELCWAARGGRLAVWSSGGWLSGGWLIADRPAPRGETLALVARQELSRAGLRRSAEARRRRWSEAPRAPSQTGGPAGFWLSCTLPALAVSLARALRLTEWDYSRLAEESLAVGGQIHLSAAGVDLLAPLDAIRISVRRAGLDIDPGWLPRWGRRVRFHYGVYASDSRPGGLS